ncbi:hypothetical protein [Geofilum rhodophaeum]|uniref:hypothetical protein n=1 Tax=Geofilum rhodophaeum TaxID=1965019 RepID=UPI0011BAD948|nr:hypothetical protein [Geofilum rhodophaeum]
MKGICFKEPLFHSTIQMRKTQTRRIANAQPDDIGPRTTNVLFEDWHGKEIRPKYKVDEIVYLKEPYIDDFSMDKIFYKFEKSDKTFINTQIPDISNPWKNKLFMPQSAARYFIKITDVRFERLQEITEEDCIKEGIEGYTHDSRSFIFGWEGNMIYQSHIEAYAALIDQISGKGTWESNPFVFVYDYELMPF